MTLLLPVHGSPPRMRGQAAFSHAGMVVLGITPADAGTSKRAIGSNGGFGDHPRGCGDKEFYDRQFPSPWGSPPRMRGQVLSFILLILILRITPADAGTSTPLCL